MLEDDRPQTVVASAEFVHAVDDVQYGLGEGPCLLAVETASTQTSGSLGGEPRWPRFGPRVGRMGVHSVLSLPLLLPDRVVGALNVYAHAKDAFGPEAVRIGELFARPAAVSVHNAQILAQSQRLAEQLGAALINRAVIDQALGVIMSRTGRDPRGGVRPAAGDEPVPARQGRRGVPGADGRGGPPRPRPESRARSTDSRARRHVSGATVGDGGSAVIRSLRDVPGPDSLPSWTSPAAPNLDRTGVRTPTGRISSRPGPAQHAFVRRTPVRITATVAEQLRLLQEISRAVTTSRPD